jgi:hypothetical protein
MREGHPAEQDKHKAASLSRHTETLTRPWLIQQNLSCGALLHSIKRGHFSSSRQGLGRIQSGSSVCVGMQGPAFAFPKLATVASARTSALTHRSQEPLRELGQFTPHNEGLLVRGSIPGKDKRVFCISKRPRRLCGPRQRLIKSVMRFLSSGVSGRGVKLTSHLHLVPRSLPNRSSYRGA